MINLNLQYPNVLIRIIPNYANYAPPPLDKLHFYGVIEQVNIATAGHSTGDVVLFQLNPGTASFVNNNIQYFFIDEHEIFSTIDNLTNKIFDYTFDFTFE